MNAVFSPALLLSIAGLTLPALASPNLPGEACPAYLVVQNNDCTVTHYTRCEGDASGTHTELVFDRDGMIFSALYTDQGRWL
ncbi:MAG TPA: hypothetical protein ENK41_06605, partial [Rhodobacteraceae bacterium]|nr:hypothetical protein [Paracoccaceae bacterium]